MPWGLPANCRFSGRSPGCIGLSLPFLLSLACMPPRAFAQAAGVNQAGPGYIHGNATNDPVQQHGGADGSDKLEQMRKADMHRRLLADAARLFQLSGELKAELDGLPRDQVSLGAMRKAAEIEKLAHSVKDGLKY